MISKEHQKKLLNLARESIKLYFEKKTPEIKEDFMRQKRGVFVTIKKNGQLFGCIGFPQPLFPLGEAIIEAARHAAFNDPRFPVLEKKDLGKIKIEMSVLTVPELVKAENPSELPKKIKVGKDGLIVKRDEISGLLLPQVAVEYKWDEAEFLSQTCIKAGMAYDAWKRPDVEVYKFQAEIFSE
ncbi:TIGR00296 family protein [Candidatus Woesearchaeota archaeon]|nr:TIGR00296 family protein [Candidatus Woesearchaeota archaeon]MBW3017468.1 TIGR00296 family protein [Candidatus Woesearchaeota archaeon]